MTREPSKKVRFILFPIIAVLFVIAAIYIVLMALGYQIYLKNNKLVTEKTGTIIVASRPGDAGIYVDGLLFAKRTYPFNIFTVSVDRLRAGRHFIKLEKKDYETWEGYFDVEAGMVSWANKIILLTQKRTADPYHFNGNVLQTLATKDQVHESVLLENTDTKFQEIWEINTAGKEKRNLFTAKDAGKYSLLAYSGSNDRILLARTFDNATTYEVLEVRENGRVWNLGIISPIIPQTAVFNPKNSSELYLLKDQNLYNFDYNSKRITDVLATKVRGVYSDNYLFVIQDNEGNMGLWRYDSNTTKSNLIKALPESDTYQVAYLPQFDAEVVLPNKDKDLYIYSTNGTPTLNKIAQGVEWFLPSPNSKFIGYKVGSSFYSYEVEKNRFYLTLDNVKFNNVSWFQDEFNLLYQTDNEVHMVTYLGFYDKKLFEDVNIAPVISNNLSGVYFAAKDTLGKIDLYTFSF